MITGNGTVGTSPQALDSVGYRSHEKLVVRAAGDNSNSIYIGVQSNVSTSTGFELTPGAEIELPPIPTNEVFVVGGASGQKYSFIAI